MYRAVTRQIEVTVEPNFVPEQSSADRSRYFWSYTIVITNSGEETVQLKTRHWIITDATGRQQEVKGEGVVGEQPTLAPGERFEYTSGVPLSTASGFMLLSSDSGSSLISRKCFGDLLISLPPAWSDWTRSLRRHARAARRCPRSRLR